MRACVASLISIAALFLSPAIALASPAEEVSKPSPDKVRAWLAEGNARFVQGKSVHPNADAKRIALADAESQSKYALATILSCSDSRVPPEIVFDAGIMDLFVIRVAGNVANTDEIGTAEYGLCHVKTPLLVVMGHTQCGAVTAVTQEVTGHGHPLERNIPPLVAPIIPAVKRTMAANPALAGNELILAAIESNVWEAIRDLFLKSPATRELVKSGKVKVVGAIYDMHGGTVKWLPQEKAAAMLKEAEASPERALNAMYQPEQAAGPSGEAKAPSGGQAGALEAKLRDIGAKVDSKTAEAASGLSDVRGRLDALASQMKTLADQGKSAAGTVSGEELKALASEVKSFRSGLDSRLASMESSGSWNRWVIIAVGVAVVVCFVLVFWKLSSLGGELELLRSKTRRAFERVNNDIKRLDG